MSERLFSEDFLRRLERLALIARRAVRGQTQGERRSPRHGQSVEFADFRPYVAGDDIRRIDWNAYARLERFFIKLFVEEEDLTVHCLIDTSPSMNWGQPGKLWYAIRAVGALGYISLSRLDRISVTAVGSDGHFPPARGKQQALPLFSFLQGLESQVSSAGNGSYPRDIVPGYSTRDVARALQAYAASASRPGPLVLLSDLMDDGWLEGLRMLGGRGFEVTVLHILAPDEVDPQIEGDFKLLDRESDATVEVTADYQLLARYRQTLTAWQEEIRRFCIARRMNYAPVLTMLPLEDLLFAWLPRKGVLR